MTTKITLPYSKLNLLTQGQQDSDFNQQLYGLSAFAVTMGATAQLKGQNATYAMRSEYVPMSIVQLVISEGGEVENYPAFFTISDPNDPTPAALPNSIKYDEDDNPSQKTWTEWAGNNAIHEIDGSYYVGTNAGTNEDLAMSTISSLLGTIISAEDFKALKPDTEI